MKLTQIDECLDNFMSRMVESWLFITLEPVRDLTKEYVGAIY